MATLMEPGIVITPIADDRATRMKECGFSIAVHLLLDEAEMAATHIDGVPDVPERTISFRVVCDEDKVKAHGRGVVEREYALIRNVFLTAHAAYGIPAEVVEQIEEAGETAITATLQRAGVA